MPSRKILKIIISNVWAQTLRAYGDKVTQKIWRNE